MDIATIFGLVSILAFFVYIANILFTVNPENKHKELWSLFGVLMLCFGWFVINMISFVIMKITETETWKAVTNTFFAIITIFSLVMIILLIVVSYYIIVYMYFSIFTHKQK